MEGATPLKERPLAGGLGAGTDETAVNVWKNGSDDGAIEGTGPLFEDDIGP
jgi:hypothetical protein